MPAAAPPTPRPSDRLRPEPPFSRLTLLASEPFAAAALAHALRARSWATEIRAEQTLSRAMTALAPDDTVIVRVAVLDRLSGRWPGERYVRRLLRTPGGPNVIAWVDADDRDALAFAVEARVPVLLTSMGADLELALQFATEMTVPGATRAEAAEFEAWFAAAYPSARWTPDVEHTLGMLISGGAANERAAWLSVALDTESARATTTRLRTVAEWLVGEVRDDDLAVRGEAMAVLRRLARLRPITASVMHSRSIARAIALLDADPSIADAAALDDVTVALLRKVHQHLPTTLGNRAGRRPAGAWRRDRGIALRVLAYAAAERGPARARVRDELDGRIADALDDLYAAAHAGASHPSPVRPGR